MKNYSDFILDKQQQELYEKLNWKAMVMGLILGVSTLNGVSGPSNIINPIEDRSENKVIEGTVTASSMDMSTAEKKANMAAKADAMKQLSAGGQGRDVTMANLSVESEIISTKKDGDGNYVITIKYKATVLDSKTKHINPLRKDCIRTGSDVTIMMNRILQKFNQYQLFGHLGVVDRATIQDMVNTFVTNNGDKYSVKMLNTQDATGVNGSIKFSASNDEGGGSDWIVITPQ